MVWPEELVKKKLADEKESLAQKAFLALRQEEGSSGPTSVDMEDEDTVFVGRPLEDTPDFG